MGKSLVVVESPAKARTITRILGDEYIVKASMGHIRDLPAKKLGVKVKENFEPEYTLNSARKKVIDDLKKDAKKADVIYLAPDPDREGEAIAWHLYEVLKKSSKAEFRRVTFHEITKTAVEHAFEESHEIDMDRVDAQQARRVLDRIVGYQVSPLLWRRGDGATSAGRVQTVALRLICEREKEITAFEPREYWSLKLDMAKKGQKELFLAQLMKLDGEKLDIPNEEMAVKLQKELQKASLSVAKLSSKQRKQNPYAPFMTSTLQQAASGALRMSPAQSMRIAQQLYEGVDLGGEGTSGLITYMRTDSLEIAKEAQQATLEFVDETYGAEYVPKKPNHYKSKGNSQGAHEAIRPTDVTRTPEFMKSYLTEEQLKLYTLIWKRFVASQMTPAIFKQESVELEAKGDSVSHEYLFRSTFSKNIFPGHLKVYAIDEEEGAKEKQKALPDLEEGEVCDVKEFHTKQHFTEPPPRFSEATLVRELEANGVGRPSTYASIVNTIQDRDYVRKQSGRLHPSKVGMDVADYLILSLPSLFEVQFTANMETKLDAIEEGDVKWTDMMGGFYEDFQLWVKQAKTAGAPPKEQFLSVLNIFHDDIPYAEPQKRGRRTYDDKKFIESLLEAIEQEKDLSAKQWGALMKLTVKYEEHLPKLPALLDGSDFIEDYEKEKEAHRERLLAAENPDTDALELLDSLNGVTFDEARKVGRREYDDSKFCDSLREQAVAGKKLTENQNNALLKVVAKYHEQVPNYKELSTKFALQDSEAMKAAQKELSALLDIFDHVTEWNEPTKKGKRVYDDKEFYESVKGQLRDKGSLSDRQVAAVKRTLKKYKDQIENFERLQEKFSI